jgi:WD40 repeat protein
VLILALVVPLAAQTSKPDVVADDKADAALKALAERCKDVSDRERDKLILDLLAFRRAHAGKSQAVEAARLQSGLRNVLDRFDPSTIPELERFTWQPRELVAVIGEHRGRQGSTVAAVAYAGDGSVAVSAGGSTVRVWDPATLRLRSTGSQASATCVAISRDGKTVASGGGTGTVVVCSLLHPEKLTGRFNTQASSSAVYSVALSPDASSLAVACFDNAVRIYDLSGKEMKATATLTNHSKAVYAVTYAPDGKTLASGGLDQTIRLWTIGERGPEEKVVLTAHAKDVTALAYNATGTTLASADRGGAIRLWHIPADGKPTQKALFGAAGGAAVHALSFSPDGKTLAAACADNTVRLWNVTLKTPREINRLDGHAGAVHGVAYAPDGKTVVTGSADWTVRSWDVTGTKPPRDRFKPRSHLSAVYGTAFSPDLHTLAAGGEDRILRLWDLGKGEPRTRQYLPGDSVRLNAVAYSPDGRAVAAGGHHKNVRQFESATGKPLRPVTGVPGDVHQLFYLPDGRLLGRGSKQFLLWNAQKGDLVRRFETTESPFICLALSPDGRQVLTGNGTYLFDKDGKYVVRDGKYVYTDCLLRLWDVESGDCVFVEKSATTPLYSVAFSADGRRALSGALEPVWKQWELAESKLKPVEGKTEVSPYAGLMVPSPDGRTLVVRSHTSAIVVFDLAGGRRPRELMFHEGVVGLAMASDSRHLAVGLATGVVYLLRLGPPAK